MTMKTLCYIHNRLIMNKYLLVLITTIVVSLTQAQIRDEFKLEKNWKFAKGDYPEAYQTDFDDADWESINIPHDWAIYGPFDEANDVQVVAVEQNLEKEATRKTGRTGGLPYMGVGWYRTSFDMDNFNKESQCASILFDGAMSEAQVFINGNKVGFWPYGYNSFHFDVTAYLTADGKNNTLAVRLENKPLSSRWYPGAGLYRNVRLVVTNKTHVPIWGTCLTTPHVSKDKASVKLVTELEHIKSGSLIKIETVIYDQMGLKVTSKKTEQIYFDDCPFEQNFLLEKPKLWTPETPNLYEAVSKIYYKDSLIDTYATSFGVRKIEFIPEKGFFLNGESRKFQGVNMHHDLGALGAAVNVAAMRHRLILLKDMGCDAIRTAHNMPAPEFVKLCDEMGFMLIVETFDEWDKAKVENGYHHYFKAWAEKDLINMIRNYRNNPSVFIWSIGNEVPTQCNRYGYKVAKYLQDICHREDPTRKVNCGMDRVSCVLDRGFAAQIDIPGLNYRTHRYEEAYNKLHQRFILGSETASTVSSRGIYKFPVEKRAEAKYDDHQSSSYDLEYCGWSNIPDEDFALAEDYEWTMGQFVWTGFDYLGEPSPYDTNAWPNHSSMFGIIDMANIPKDRYYLYRSIWNKNEETLHILPHWNWEGREGETTPVFVYTNYNSAELFVNGKSQGIQMKNDSTVQNRYRLMWMDVKYEPGEVKVVAFDDAGRAVASKTIKTAGKPHHIELVPDRIELMADGKDLSFVTVRIVDKDGNLCPTASNQLKFKVIGAGTFKAVANGDPTNLELFHLPQMHAFNGMLEAIVQTDENPGTIHLKVSASGLKAADVMLQSK